MRLTAMLALLLSLFAGTANAVNPDEVLADPALEARARALSVDIRCLVCQNQSIDDSDADLAKDLRKLVREKLKSGASDDKIKAYLVARYGEFVLLRPRIKSDTYLLWFGPVLILLAGAFGVFVFLRRRSAGQASEAAPALSKDEEKRIAALIGEKD